MVPVAAPERSASAGRNRVPELYCAQIAQSRFCENFHEQSLVRFFFMVNQCAVLQDKVPDLSHRILDRQQKRQKCQKGQKCYNVVRNTTAVPFLDATKLRWPSA